MSDTKEMSPDRRRFKVVWQELLIARFLVPLCAGAVGCYLLGTSESAGASRNLAGIVLIGIAFPLPVLVAKRGLYHYALVGAAAALVLGASFMADDLKESTVAIASITAVVTTMALIEFLFERDRLLPLVTIAAAALMGLAAGKFYQWADIATGADAVTLKEIRMALGLETLLGFVAMHLAVGLAVALGRYARDRSKNGTPVEKAPPQPDGPADDHGESGGF